MNLMRILKLCAADRRGGTVLEFAILGPVFIAMMFGVLYVGIQMRSFNAMRSIAADVNRYTVVEYQKANTLTATQIRDVASAMAVQPPYGMNGEQLDVSVENEESPIDGAREYKLVLTYTPFNPLRFTNLDGPTITYHQSIYVPDIGEDEEG